MFQGKSYARRAEIRKNRPDIAWADWQKLKDAGVPASIAIALAFFLVASAILMLRQNVVPYRLGQWLNHDVVSRVDFRYSDPVRLEARRNEVSMRVPRVFKLTGDVWTDLEQELLKLPDIVRSTPELPPDLRNIFDSGAVTSILEFATADSTRADYTRRVSDYVDALRQYRVIIGGEPIPLCIIDADERTPDARMRKPIKIDGERVIDSTRTFSLKSPELRDIFSAAARKTFRLALQPAMVDFTLAKLQPTYKLDSEATVIAQTAARNAVTAADVQIWYAANQVLVTKSNKDSRPLDDAGLQLWRAEHVAYIKSIKGYRWVSRVGVAGIVLAITALLAGYIVFYQPRILKNHARQAAVAGLLLSMLLLNQIAAIGTGPLYLFGIAPTLLVAMILTIAYDQRSAMGIATMHALLATVALNQGVTFFIVLWVGILSVCFLLDDIRTRSKLIEVAGATALAMAGVTAAAGMLAFDPWQVIQQNCLFAGAAGLGVGFVVLGILPFIEKAFRITTSMTLLEMADVSQPLLRRLAVEAPGTYSHSLQVAALSEAAAESIGCDSLLCRVASYYHDVGKINKADYFCENQTDGENRHINLSPSVSLLVIIGHVKDGVELGREYNLPSSIIPFIQQHHGTTLVEYFFHQARSQHERNQPDMPAVSDTQYRYPGPKPKSREVAIVMISDAVEIAARTMGEPTAARIEGLIHDLIMKRLLDGQFDDCDLTMRDLETIKFSLMKTLTGIYHGRIAYPAMKTANMNTSTAVATRTA